MGILNSLGIKKRQNVQVPSGVFLGTREAWEWTENFKYNGHMYNKFVQPIHDNKVYKMVTQCCNEKQAYELQQLVSKHGIRCGLEMFLRKIRQWRMTSQFQKKYEVERLGTQVNEKADPDELIRLVRREQEDRKEAKQKNIIRNSPRTLTDDKVSALIIGKTPIDKGYSDQNAFFAIFDKIHGQYVGIVSSPYRMDQLVKTRQSKWKQIVIKGKDLNDVRTRTKQFFNKEAMIQAGQSKKKAQPSNIRKRQIQNIDIDHVKAVMGIELDEGAADALKGDDIF